MISPSPVPANPPENVTAMVESSTTIAVMWEEVPPIDQNGVITMYEVMYTPLETFGGTLESDTVNVSGSNMSVVLNVRAFTDVGAGPYSVAGTVLTPEAGMCYCIEK